MLEQDPLLFDLGNLQMLIVLLRNQFEEVEKMISNLGVELNLLEGRINKLEDIGKHAILDRKIESEGA